MNNGDFIIGPLVHPRYERGFPTTFPSAVRKLSHSLINWGKWRGRATFFWLDLRPLLVFHLAFGPESPTIHSPRPKPAFRLCVYTFINGSAQLENASTPLPPQIKRKDPFTRSDLELQSSEWSSAFIGKLSPWIRCDSESERLRTMSESALLQVIPSQLHRFPPRPEKLNQKNLITANHLLRFLSTGSCFCQSSLPPCCDHPTFDQETQRSEPRSSDLLCPLHLYDHTDMGSDPSLSVVPYVCR